MARRSKSSPPAGKLALTLTEFDPSLTSEAVDAYADLGARLASQLAEEAFHRITSDPGWSSEDAEEETEYVLGRMEILARDMNAARGLDPDAPEWNQIWGEMERRYRQRMDELLRMADPDSRGTVQ